MPRKERRSNNKGEQCSRAKVWYWITSHTSRFWRSERLGIKFIVGVVWLKVLRRLERVNQNVLTRLGMGTGWEWDNDAWKSIWLTDLTSRLFQLACCSFVSWWLIEVSLFSYENFSHFHSRFNSLTRQQRGIPFGIHERWIEWKLVVSDSTLGLYQRGSNETQAK
jgi:hypothetical protein